LFKFLVPDRYASVNSNNGVGSLRIQELKDYLEERNLSTEGTKMC
jgi:hypothetical protein